MRITLFIPCHNEAQAIRQSARSWLNQTRPADEIIVVDDSSTDATPLILREPEFAGKITVVRTPRNLGNKSHAQEFGLQFVTGDIFVTSDGDTLLAPDFIERIEKDFENPTVAAVGGYVKSLKYNWLTRHRAFEYSIGQNLHKLAQSYLGFMFVIPGAAGAFRTHVFREYLSFDHDTITEDLDFTYKLHKNGFKILFDRNAIVYTQDPATIRCYFLQMQRWFGGGWQNLRKHYSIASFPPQALELSLMYIEGVVYSVLAFLIPILNIRLAGNILLLIFSTASVLSVFAAIREKRLDMLLVPFPYLFLLYVNAYVFLEQFVKEFIFHKRQNVWISPKRLTLA